MAKIEIHNPEKNFKLVIKKLEKDLSKQNFQLIKGFIDDMSLGLIGKSRKRPIKSTQIKIIYRLKTIAKYFDQKNKAIDKITLSDMKELIRDLQEDTIQKSSKKKNPKPEDYLFSERIKTDFKKEYIRFLKHRWGQTKRFRELTEWIDLSYPEKEIVYYKKEDIDRLILSAKSLIYKTLIAVSFDGGFRVEELLNVRFSDIEKDEEEQVYFINLKPEYTKTKKSRIVYLYLDQTNKLLEEYLKQIKGGLEDPIFEVTYDAWRVALAKLSKKILGKAVKPHDLRRSSATHFSNSLNNYQLTARYGWSISSKVPNKYISASGIQQKQISKKLKQQTLGDIKEQLDRVKQDNRILKDYIKQHEEKLENGMMLFLEKLGQSLSGKAQDILLKEINKQKIPLNVLPIS